MAGDTYVPPRYDQESTRFDNGNVLDFKLADERLKGYNEVSARSAAKRAIASVSDHEVISAQELPPQAEILQLGREISGARETLAAA